MNKKLATTFAITAGVLWGIISIFINALSEYQFSSAEMSFLRALTCAVIMFLTLLIYDRSLLKIRLRDIWMFLGTGVISLTLFNCCYFKTILQTEASIAVSLLYTSPVFVMLFSALLFKEAITLKKVITIILTVTGCTLISGMIGSGARLGLMPLLTGIGAGLFYALYSIFGRYATNKYHPFTVTFYTFVFGSVGFLFILNPLRTVSVLAGSGRALVLVLLLSIVCGMLPYIFYTAGLKHLDTSAAGILVAVEPLVGNLVGIIGFKESVSPMKLLGIVLILSSIVLLSVDFKAQRKA